MKSYYVQPGAGIDAMTLLEEEMPQPGYGEVLIRVMASALNYRELMIIRDGVYVLPLKQTLIPVADGVGEVVATGSGTHHFTTGDRVAAVVFPEWTDGPFTPEFSAQLGGSLDGMLTTYKVLPERSLVKIPDHLSWEEAAAFPCAGVTAWNALTDGRPLKAGENVLTLGTGGVSLFALQFAKLSGARVIATTSSGEKAEKLLALGADEVINYRIHPEWHREVRRLTDGHGADHIIEVGGPGTMNQSFQSLHLHGEVSIIGAVANDGTLPDINLFSAGCGTMRRVALGSRAHHMAMHRAVSAGRLKPVIDRVFPFREARAAMHYFETGQAFGKVIISHS
ncbi:NAD(P)-dependent alcohol dehydrogenase [Chitinophaga sp. Mgbs1]|uniref:NAD(P)-dependent alcohol dehydrogenase n=1 Tax=Chitinophaga solisilvae TaxID=1233460 RepID=A0A3S1DNA6_9BACT|nr:NAD(P)-dependent alcohol dehydrogenase [Chitinophaga solisilvae]